MINKDCPFCRDVFPKVEWWDRGGDVHSFTPLNPVTPGHRLFVPWQHIEHDDIGAAEAVGKCMQAAQVYGAHYELADSFNLITSFGPDSTQTVPHIHIHFVPRVAGDGLALPWGLPHD